MTNNLPIAQHGDQFVVDSRLIADRLGVEHHTFLKTLNKYLNRIESKFGVVRFEVDKPLEGTTGGRPEKYALLTEPQATTLMTFSRNTDEVIECKFALVEAFEKAKSVIKEVIPAQSDRIRELELANENMKLQLEYVSKQDNRIALHGLPVALLLEGKAHAVVEVEKPTIEIIDERHNVSFKGQTLKQLAEYLSKISGIRFKSGADLKRALEKLGRGDLIAQTLRSVPSDYIPEEFVLDAIQALTNGDRQQLIGE